MFSISGYVSTKALRVALVVALGATLAALAAIALVASSPAARAANGNCQSAGSAVVCTFGSGTSTWTVPDGVTEAYFEVFGAQGGNSGSPGGLGGAATATFSDLQPGSQLQINVGGAGATSGLGGANGGGDGRANGGAGGGGASDVRVGGFALNDRIIVAGGGGGGGGDTTGCPVGPISGGSGGSGGGSSGAAGVNGAGADNGGGGGEGGTNVAGGTGGSGTATGLAGETGILGVGGRGGSAIACGGGGGGGGGGYYGGGGGAAGASDVLRPGGGGGGGGGSGYVSPQGVSAQLQSGVRQGGGSVRITYIPPSPPTPPALSIGDRSVPEGNSGTSPATFTVSLSESSAQQVKVDYATADGTAAAGEDYQASSGTLTFAPGQTSQTVTVLVNGDTKFEPDETFFVDLNNPTNATISKGRGIGTITNDDPPPDTTAPTVVSTFPSDGGTMRKSDLVTATFSEAVKGVSEQTFYLKKYTIDRRGKETYVPVTAKVTSPNDHTAVLRPTKDLQLGTYQATITQGVTDNAGNALVPKTWSFKVTR